MQEKKEKSERMFKEWLQNSSNKGRPASGNVAYANGKCPGLYLYLTNEHCIFLNYSA